MFAVLTWILGILREYLLWLKFFLRFSPLFAAFKSRSVLKSRVANCGEKSNSISAQGDLGLSVKSPLHLDDPNLRLSQLCSEILFSGSGVLTWCFLASLMCPLDLDK
jgi:hypothetical protein